PSSSTTARNQPRSAASASGYRMPTFAPPRAPRGFDHPAPPRSAASPGGENGRTSPGASLRSDCHPSLLQIPSSRPTGLALSRSTASLVGAQGRFVRLRGSRDGEWTMRWIRRVTVIVVSVMIAGATLAVLPGGAHALDADTPIILGPVTGG